MSKHHRPGDRPIELCMLCNREPRRRYSHKCETCASWLQRESLGFRVIYGEQITINTTHLVNITPERLAELERAERALKDISSGSPAVFNPGTPHEFKCSLCHAHIDEARRALGYQLWPAVPHTPIAPPSAPTNDAHLHH